MAEPIHWIFENALLRRCGRWSCRAMAATFGVSVASVVKWSQRFRASGSAAA